MKKVILYQATAREVNTFACGSIPIHNRGEPIQFAHNDPSHRAFFKSEIKIEHCAIERFVWQNGDERREVFVAFDNALLEVIGCKQDQVDKLVDSAVNKQCKVTNLVWDKLTIAQREIERYDTMTLWQRVKWVFKIQ